MLVKLDVLVWKGRPVNALPQRPRERGTSAHGRRTTQEPANHEDDRACKGIVNMFIAELQLRV